jgi:hypothetical protein
MAKSKANISWEAPEFKFYEKSAGWYVTLISISILLIGFFVLIQKDIFASITMGIITLLIIFFSRQTPRTVTVELNSKGINHGAAHMPYKQIKHFWVVDKEHHKTLNFETSSYLNKIMVIELNEQDPDEVREFLLSFLIEHPDTEPTTAQRVMHWFKF